MVPMHVVQVFFEIFKKPSHRKHVGEGVVVVNKFIYMVLVILFWFCNQPLFLFSIISDISEQELIDCAEELIDDCVAAQKQATTQDELDALEQWANLELRSLIGEAVDSESKSLGVKFNATAFSNNNFYCGASEMPPDETYALARASVQNVRAEDGTVSKKVVVVALAQDEGTKVNGAEASSTLKGQVIDTLTLMGKRYPVATIAMSDGSTLDKVILLNDELFGKDLRTNNTHELHDAADKALADGQKIADIAASSDTIFLAVPPSGGDFGAENSGFVRFKKGSVATKGLEMQKRDGSVGQDFAYKLNLDAHTIGQKYPISPLKDSEQVQISFSIDPMKCPYITGAQVDAPVDMYWDSKLNRLYVGLSGVSGDMDQKGGVFSVLVGRVDPTTNTMVMQPIVSFEFAQQSLPSNDLTRIVGFQHDRASKVQASAFKVRTMNTSTGKDYVIINGGVELNTNSAKLNPLVSALPLVPTKNGFTKNNDAKYIGLLASTQNRSSVAKNVSQLLSKNDLESKVGFNPGYLAHNLSAFQKDPAPQPPVCEMRKFLNQTEIVDMNVVGDTVYISTAGMRDATAREEQGIFASTAIFDEQGTIRAWTPWERVMGNIESVLGFGLDTATQNYFYLDSSQQMIKVTQWGSGDFTTTDSGGIHNQKPLSTVLDGFPQSLTGTQTFGAVYNLVNFDDETPGFKAYTPEKEFAPFSMMVATGNKKVALVQTGKRDMSNVFQQTREFITGDKTTQTQNNVFIFNDEALKGATLTGNAAKDAKLPKGIGQIVTAEVSRTPLISQPFISEGKGWLFVGGTKGIAAFKDLFGFGWSTNKNAGLSQLVSGDAQQTYAFPGKGYLFVQLFDTNGINLFNDTRKLVADGKYLYIMTSKKIWRYEMNEEDFGTGKIASERLVLIIDVDESRDAQGNKFLEGQQLSDVLILDKTTNARRFLLATSNGVWINNNPLTDNGDVVILMQSLPPLESLAWTNKISNVAGTGSVDDQPFPLGQVVNLQLIPARRGGGFNGDTLDANLYVRAADQTNKTLAVYRFNIQNQDDPQNAGTKKVFVKAFKEPYFRDTVLDENKIVQEANRTKEFYKIGTMDPQVALVLDDPLEVPLGFSAQAVPLVPNPAFFVQANQDNSAIDFKQKIRINDRFPKFVHDTASGAVYVPGLFGVAVNE